MDAFMLPSFFEGIPVVGVEAQYAGLTCFFSDKVPKEVAFNGRCYFWPLEMKAEEWAQNIVNTMNDMQARNEMKSIDDRYDITKSYAVLEKLYLDLFKELA